MQRCRCSAVIVSTILIFQAPFFRAFFVHFLLMQANHLTYIQAGLYTLSLGDLAIFFAWRFGHVLLGDLAMFLTTSHSVFQHQCNILNNARYKGVSHQKCSAHITCPKRVIVREHIQTFQFNRYKTTVSPRLCFFIICLKRDGPAPPSPVIIVLDALSNASGKAIAPSL